jgi:probable addiction module antidote protein
MSTSTRVRAAKKTHPLASRPYEPWLKQRLATDPEKAKHYLEAAMGDENPRVFLLALKEVAEAFGGIPQLAKVTGLNRENLYRMLSEKGNPELSSLNRVLQALGLRLRVEPADRSSFDAFVENVKRDARQGNHKRMKAKRHRLARANS